MKILLLALMGASALYGQRVVASGQISSVSGNGSTMVTSTGPQTSGNCVTIDANGNHVPSAQPCGTVASTTLVMGLPLTNATFPAVRGYNIAAGDVDLYTAPAGKRVIAMNAGGMNTSAGTINWYLELKSASTVVSTCTNSNPVVCATVSAPVTGTAVALSGLTTGWTALNNTFTATKISATTFSVPLDSTAFGVFSATNSAWSGYYRITPSVAVLTHVQTAAGAATWQLILEPGESMSVHTDAAGLNLSAGVIQFDSTSPLRTVKLLGPASGDNTLYTAPFGKTARILPTDLTIRSIVPSALFFVSDAGGTRNINLCDVAVGGSTACASNSVNELLFGSALASVKTTFQTTDITLNAGDFMVLNVDVGNAAQIAWINVLEI
jgi:hypothetical protein